MFSAEPVSIGSLKSILSVVLEVALAEAALGVEASARTVSIAGSLRIVETSFVACTVNVDPSSEMSTELIVWDNAFAPAIGTPFRYHWSELLEVLPREAENVTGSFS